MNRRQDKLLHFQLKAGNPTTSAHKYAAQADVLGGLSAGWRPLVLFSALLCRRQVIDQVEWT